MNDIEKFLYSQWVEYATEDDDITRELKDIENKPAEIQDRFYRELEFGTGGLRGKLGAGTNRMNIYTVRKATLGLASYLRQTFDSPSIAISYDSRRKSRLFADEVAQTMSSCGVNVHIFDRLMPTPVLSFAVRHLECSAGVMITASHNPAEYNGYKVYGADGCQITDDAAKTITQYIATANIFTCTKNSDPSEHTNNCITTSLSNHDCGPIKTIPESVIEHYYSAVLTERVECQQASKASNLSIVYSPLHGSGLEPVMSVLEKAGYTNINVVSSQRNPDGNFPTCPYPNPELPEALDEGIKYMNEIDGKLLLATDPDCDRVGVVADNHILTGNEIGVLLLDYICKMRKQNGTMPDNPIAVKTTVTTDMAEKIAAFHGVKLISVLTGFKYIGEFIGELEKANNEKQFIFGFEESCGYLSGTYARDKDAVNAVLLICDMATYYATQGLTLSQQLNNLYEAHGYYECALDSFTFEGADGLKTMSELTTSLRTQSPNNVFDIPAKKRIDYLDKSQNKNLPCSNVLQYTLIDNTVLTIRPSGTEPKMKIYYQVVQDSKENAANTLKTLQSKIHSIFMELLCDL